MLILGRIKDSEYFCWFFITLIFCLGHWFLVIFWCLKADISKKNKWKVWQTIMSTFSSTTLSIYWGIILINHLGKKYEPKTAKTSKCTKSMQITQICLLSNKQVIDINGRTVGAFPNLTLSWPPHNPYWGKIGSKYFLTQYDFISTNNWILSKWHLSTSAVFNYKWLESYHTSKCMCYLMHNSDGWDLLGHFVTIIDTSNQSCVKTAGHAIATIYHSSLTDTWDE